MMNIGIQFKYIHCAKKLKEMRGKKTIGKKDP